uniref:Uncharacterized protein n=1 Tax=Lactuca sativa TaxID=4236 RepID=A0A9R1VWI7_LACSA|nr:hypothetical protein LSAT_V11C400215930 [Lactuca sativa]
MPPESTGVTFPVLVWPTRHLTHRSIVIAFLIYKNHIQYLWFSHFGVTTDQNVLLDEKYCIMLDIMHIFHRMDHNPPRRGNTDDDMVTLLRLREKMEQGYDLGMSFGGQDSEGGKVSLKLKNEKIPPAPHDPISVSLLLIDEH